MTTRITDALLTEPDPRYRQQAKTNLSSHALADFRACPRLYRDKQLAEAGCLAKPIQITVRQTAGEEFDRIIDYRLGDKPVPREPGMDDDESMSLAAWSDYDDSEVPF